MCVFSIILGAKLIQVTKPVTQQSPLVRELLTVVSCRVGLLEEREQVLTRDPSLHPLSVLRKAGLPGLGAKKCSKLLVLVNCLYITPERYTPRRPVLKQRQGN